MKTLHFYFILSPPEAVSLLHETKHKIHESPPQHCVHVAKFLAEVISDLDEIRARYSSPDMPLLDFENTNIYLLQP